MPPVLQIIRRTGVNQKEPTIRELENKAKTIHFLRLRLMSNIMTAIKDKLLVIKLRNLRTLSLNIKPTCFKE
jgi:hypothetical protein